MNPENIFYGFLNMQTQTTFDLQEDNRVTPNWIAGNML